MKTVSHKTKSPQETRKLASDFIEKHNDNKLIIALHGDLGSGKTCFVQGLAAGLKCRRFVTSPTFTLINEYHDGIRPLYHIDLYRLENERQVHGLGFEDYLESDGIVAVEWAERAGDLLPAKTIHIQFKTTDDPEERIITILNRQEKP